MKEEIKAEIFAEDKPKRKNKKNKKKYEAKKINKDASSEYPETEFSSVDIAHSVPGVKDIIELKLVGFNDIEKRKMISELLVYSFEESSAFELFEKYLSTCPIPEGYNLANFIVDKYKELAPKRFSQKILQNYNKRWEKTFGYLKVPFPTIITGYLGFDKEEILKSSKLIFLLLSQSPEAKTQALKSLPSLFMQGSAEVLEFNSFFKCKMVYKFLDLEELKEFDAEVQKLLRPRLKPEWKFPMLWLMLDFYKEAGLKSNFNETAQEILQGQTDIASKDRFLMLVEIFCNYIELGNFEEALKYSEMLFDFKIDEIFVIGSKSEEIRGAQLKLLLKLTEAYSTFINQPSISFSEVFLRYKHAAKYDFYGNFYSLLKDMLCAMKNEPQESHDSYFEQVRQLFNTDILVVPQNFSSLKDNWYQIEDILRKYHKICSNTVDNYGSFEDFQAKVDLIDRMLKILDIGPTEHDLGILVYNVHADLYVYLASQEATVEKYEDLAENLFLTFRDYQYFDHHVVKNSLLALISYFPNLCKRYIKEFLYNLIGIEEFWAYINDLDLWSIILNTIANKILSYVEDDEKVAILDVIKIIIDKANFYLEGKEKLLAVNADFLMSLLSSKFIEFVLTYPDIKYKVAEISKQLAHKFQAINPGYEKLFEFIITELEREGDYGGQEALDQVDVELAEKEVADEIVREDNEFTETFEVVESLADIVNTKQPIKQKISDLRQVIDNRNSQIAKKADAYFGKFKNASWEIGGKLFIYDAKKDDEVINKKSVKKLALEDNTIINVPGTNIYSYIEDAELAKLPENRIGAFIKAQSNGFTRSESRKNAAIDLSNGCRELKTNGDDRFFSYQTYASIDSKGIKSILIYYCKLTKHTGIKLLSRQHKAEMDTVPNCEPLVNKTSTVFDQDEACADISLEKKEELKLLGGESAADVEDYQG